MTAFFNQINKGNCCMKKFILFAMLAVALTGCAGLNYNQESGNAAQFHPKTTVILPVKMPEGMELEGEKIGNILTDALTSSKNYGSVIDPSTTRNQLASKDNKELSDNVTSYLAKLIITGVSDGELSKKIGNAYHADTIIFADMSRYGYISFGGTKYGEVGFSIKVIDSASGTVYWKAGHTDQESYVIFKPDLGEMARTLMQKVISYSPFLNK